MRHSREPDASDEVGRSRSCPASVVRAALPRRVLVEGLGDGFRKVARAVEGSDRGTGGQSSDEGDAYPSPHMWSLAGVGVYPSFPFPEGLEKMRRGSS